jgi:hypothetical protein
MESLVPLGVGYRCRRETMRNLHKLLLLAIAAVAAFAFSASAASAQSGVELLLEDNGHCSDVVMDNHEPTSATCTVHATGTAELYQHVAGVGEVLFSVCDNEFEAAFNESGAGFIYHQVLTPEGSSCGREVCDEAEGQVGEPGHTNMAWPAQLSEAPGVTPLRLAVTFCLYAHSADPASEGSAGTPCSVNLWVNTDGQHNYEVTSTDPVTGEHAAPCVNLGGIVELEGHWVTGVTPAHPNRFEVVHL